MALPEHAEQFLKELRRGLGAMAPDEREDVVQELRSHLLERQAQGRTDLLAGFESAQDLAASFVAENALRGALAVGTPWAFGRALLVAARDSLLALFLLFPLLLTQIVAFFCVLTAVLKAFSPADFGLWMGNGSFYVGRRSELAHEVLGNWGVPVLLLAGLLLFWGSNRALRALASWRLRSYRSLRH